MIRTVLAILLACLLFTSCGKSAIEEGKIVIRPDIVNNPIYKQLDKQKEPLDIISYLHKTEKAKTSDVNYLNDRNRPLKGNAINRNYICSAKLSNDTLTIDFGLNSFFGGQGFDIICSESKYMIKPYYVTDVVIIGAKIRSDIQIIKQSLILNKNKYQLGDSIYGYVDFNLIENEKTIYEDENNKAQKIIHIGKGYFRGKIEKLN